MDEAWWQVESHFILCTLCCLSRVCHIIKETVYFSPAAVFSRLYASGWKSQKLRKWKLKNFIKLVSAINYKIYVFKGDIHKTLVNVVPSQKNHSNSQAHEKCLMSRTWTEWNINEILMEFILLLLFYTALPVFSRLFFFFSLFPSSFDSSVPNITSTKKD